MIFLTFLLLLSWVALGFLTRKLILSLEKIDEIKEQVEESLDIIDQNYKGISKLLETPVLFDDPVVIDAVNQIKSSKESLLLVANKIVDPFVESEE